MGLLKGPVVIRELVVLGSGQLDGTGPRTGLTE